MHTVSEKIDKMCSNKRDKMITGGKNKWKYGGHTFLEGRGGKKHNLVAFCQMDMSLYLE